MQSKAYILTAFLCGVSVLCAQDPSAQPPSSPPPSTQAPPPTTQAPSGTSSSTSPDQSGNSAGTYVRRFTIGATLSVVGLGLVSGSTNTVTNSTTVSTAYDTTPASSRIGYGITGQVAVTDRFAVAIGGYIRKIGYELDTTITTTAETSLNGVLTSTSSSTSTHEDTRARLYDIPVVLRYFSKGRHTPGPRWFVEAGGAYRDATNIRTSVSATDVNGILTCCTNVSAVPQRHNSPGAVVGAGFQLIDPVGIRVIPEVRYTRWIDQIFDGVTTHTQRNQIEAALTLSF
jgi:hypothetical protein